MFQKMNAIQMWRAGCKRSLFSDFYHIGISVAENLLLSTLDKLADTFDKGLKQWKIELQEHIFPSNSAMETEDASSVSDDDTDISQLSSIVSSESSESMDEWEDIAEESVLEEPNTSIC
ncbi:uncharacterized protein LOC132736946 [Ruditapes philippinarum]|uniref:uncharacterized protein LOC132736946 n=1 Tax=Ruditapes philippinarum TaxID=129788 RepID=UPI00295A5C27|nr:uncharacterized protein LOC132736946 [Ruditapes philippinarum]